MKKFLKRILGIISVLIIGYQQFCYADVVVIEPIDEFRPIAFLIGFIGVIVLIITSISFFALKSTIKKQSEPEFNFENANDEKIEKKQNRIQRRFYMWGMILAIVGLIYLRLSDEISIITFFIPIILFVVSFIVRINKKKKVSNIICGISVALVCIIAIWVGVSNKVIENYNKQFLQYQKSESSYWASPRYVSDVEGLINTAIKNNKSGRKTTIIYQNTNYTSPDALKELLSMLNTSKSYSLNIKYDNNYDYIESITLTSYINQSLRDLLQYEGNSQRGSIVKSLIQVARSKVLNNDYYEDIKINIVYTSETGQKTTININTDNSEDITNLRNEIKVGKTYNVEIQTDSNNDVCNIIITANN